ncbi:ParB/RepB/Spo0J family partition protein, partial [Candidatus Falkowbacteria bacterium]|nr:ParB/RepB/Spo0J family partition protein [Candidatus Falkowbacteria bacterium]
MALGKGLGSLIPQKPSSAVSVAPAVIDSKDIILQLDPQKISVNTHQPRTHFDPSELENLMNSIKVHGIISPLVATKRADGSYELIAGERRLRSAKALGLPTVPVIIRDVKEQEKLEIALIENIQRKQLSAIEEARSYERLLSEFNLTQEEVSKRVGKSRSSVAHTLRLLELPQV